MLGCCHRPPPRTRARPRSVWQRALPALFFEHENEDDDEDEKQSIRHFRHLPPCPGSTTASKRPLSPSAVFEKV